MRILLIEDDEMIGPSLAEAVREAGFSVDWIRDGISGQSAFELSELLARLRAVIRRYDGHAQSTVGTDELRLDLGTREVIYKGVRAALSAREFALLGEGQCPTLCSPAYRGSSSTPAGSRRGRC